MRVAIFLENIENQDSYKCFGQLALGFKDLGHEVIAMCFSNRSIDFPLNIVRIKESDFFDKSIWDDLDIDLIVFYSWLSIRFNKFIECLNNLGIKCVIKLDSNGRLCYPFFPSYLRGFGHFTDFKDFLSFSFRFLEWSILWKYLSKKKLQQIHFSDFTIIESPDALINLYYILHLNRKYNLAKKVNFIPSPVDTRFLETSQKNEKNNLIISIGRWESRSKNRECISYLLKNFDRIDDKWEIAIFGSHSDYFQNKIKYLPDSVQSRIKIIGRVGRTELFEYYQKAKILFIPSRWESVGLVAEEAIVSGCSIAGTPNESLKYFAMQGFSGSISSSFRNASVFASLLCEIKKWDASVYDPVSISRFWRNKLDRKIIAESIINLLGGFVSNEK